MKEIGRIKVDHGWMILIVSYLNRQELAEDNFEWSDVNVDINKIPTIDIAFSRRKAHRERMRHRCQRSINDYLLLKKLINIVQTWLLNEQPKLIYVGAINDEYFEKRMKFYRKFFYRNGYIDYDNNYSIVECTDDQFSFYWLMEKDV